jgi:hypothetical protein
MIRISVAYFRPPQPCVNLKESNRRTACLAPRLLTPGSMLIITDLLRDAADALENAYKGREDARCGAGTGRGATGAC